MKNSRTFENIKWSLQFLEEYSSHILAQEINGVKRLTENPDNPALEAIEFISQFKTPLKLLVTSPCSETTLNAIIKAAGDLRKLIIVDNNKKRWEVWQKGIPSLKNNIIKQILLPSKKEKAGKILVQNMIDIKDELLLGNSAVYFPRRFKRIDPGFCKFIKDIILKKQQQICSETAVGQVKNWHKNLCSILNCDITSYKIENLEKSRIRNKAIIIVGAGPSLDFNAQTLANYGDRAYIISTDGALSTLFENNVSPDIIVSIDNNPVTWQYFLPFTKILNKIPLVVSTNSNYILVKHYPGPVILTHENEENSWISELYNKLPGITHGNCVGHTAFHLAEQLSPSKIILMGFDLALRDNKYHTKGMKYAYYKQNNQDTINYITVDGKNGEKIKSELALSFYLKYFEEIIQKTKTTIIDCTEGGALIKGTEISTIKSILEKEKKIEDKEIIINHNQIKPPSKTLTRQVKFSDRLADYLNHMKAKVKKIKDSPISRNEWCINWLMKDKPIYSLLTESGNVLELLKYRDTIRAASFSSNQISDSYLNLLNSLIDTGNLFLNALRLRIQKNKTEKIKWNNNSLIIKPMNPHIDYPFLLRKIGRKNAVRLESSTTLPLILDTINTKNINELITFNGNIIPEAWTIADILCTDIKTENYNLNDDLTQRKLWIPGYKVKCTTTENYKTWNTSLPSTISCSLI